MSKSMRTPLKVLDTNQQSRTGMTPCKAEPSMQEKNLKFAAEDKHDLEEKMHQVLDEYDELRKRYATLEQRHHEMKVTLINVEEEASEWKQAYDSLQAEGRELFQTYERKCTALKLSSQQLEELKKELTERDEKLAATHAEIETMRTEEREIKAKYLAQTEAASKHEMRYLSLKDEHAQALNKVDSLISQLKELKELNASLAAGNRAPEQPAASSAGEPSVSPSTGTWEQPCALPFATPVRSTKSLLGGATPKLVMKTPGGVLRELEDLSPSGIKEHAESLVISNDLLRQELVQLKAHEGKHALHAAQLQTRVRELEEQITVASASLKDSRQQLSDAIEARDSAMQAEKDAIRALERDRSMESGQVAKLAAEAEMARALQAEAEGKVSELEAEKMVLRKKLEVQTESTKNAEKDMRLLFKRHKKELQELSEKFKEGMYEQRYQQAVRKANRLSELLQGWVAYARELSEVKTLQAEYQDCTERAVEKINGLVEHFAGASAEAGAQVARWSKKTHRMEQDMMRLVHIKTKALEDKKELQAKLAELTEELTAQGEYALQLENNERSIMEQHEDDRAALAAEHERVLKKHADAALRAENEAHVRGLVHELVASVQARAAQEEVGMLQAQVLELSQEVEHLHAAAEVSDKMFADATALLQERDEAIEVLKKQVEEGGREAAGLRAELREAETFSKAEICAAQEALDELTRALSQAQDQIASMHEQLVHSQEAAEKAEASEGACKLAAACGISRLAQLAVEFAGHNDDASDMIDQELRQNCYESEYEYRLAQTKTGAELRALLVGLASSLNHLLACSQQRNEALERENDSLAGATDALEKEKQQLIGAEALALELEHSLAAAEAKRKLSDEHVQSLEARVEEMQAQAESELTMMSALMEKKLELESLLEITSRENMELSEYKSEALSLKEQLADVHHQLAAAQQRVEDAHDRYSAAQARAVEVAAETQQVQEKAEKRLNTLRANLQRSEAECASIDAMLAHVRAVLHMYLDDQKRDEQPLRALMHRLCPDDSSDEMREGDTNITVMQGESICVALR